MDISLSEEQFAWQMKARKFAQEVLRPASLARDRIAAPRETFDWDIIRQGSQLGFRTAVVSKEFGGHGIDMVTQALVQLLKDGLGHKGWLWKMKFRYKKMDLAGESLCATAEVTGLQVIDGLGFVTLSILLLTDKDEISTVGTAIGVLPLRGGRAVPYPFERKAEYAVLQLPADD